MNRRQRQLENNLNALLGMYENGMSDNGLTEYPQMTAKEVIAYCKGAGGIYDIMDNGMGHTMYRAGICKDLKFLGTEYINDRILDIAAECGILKEGQEC